MQVTVSFATYYPLVTDTGKKKDNRATYFINREKKGIIVIPTP